LKDRRVTAGRLLAGAIGCPAANPRLFIVVGLNLAVREFVPVAPRTAPISRASTARRTQRYHEQNLGGAGLKLVLAPAAVKQREAASQAYPQHVAVELIPAGLSPHL
jgi:hypothetical protein